MSYTMFVEKIDELRSDIMGSAYKCESDKLEVCSILDSLRAEAANVSDFSLDLIIKGIQLGYGSSCILEK